MRLIELEYDVDASVRLIICGVIVRRWAPVDFMGWGHPLTPFFVTTGEWMRHPDPPTEP